MDRRNIGGEHRRTDHPPAEGAAGQEVAAGRASQAAGGKHADGQDAEHIDDDDDEVEDGNAERGLRSWCSPLVASVLRPEVRARGPIRRAPDPSPCRPRGPGSDMAGRGRPFGLPRPHSFYIV
ncbi:MAG: hypothetical protein MZV63_58980 [Marinilabiliales bacterium]|nr:hypothetical protein [Marinilabiliales bacterium]